MGRAWANDARGAVALVEGAIASHVFVTLPESLPFPTTNVFGEALRVEGPGPDRAAQVRAFVERARDAARSGGGRVSLVADAATLGAAREELRTLVEARASGVVHVLADDGGADALALADLGFGLLFASTVEESIDLSLVARRASEDAGTPFFVVHEDARGRHVEAVTPPPRELCEAFLSGAHLDAVENGGAEREAARAHAERVPFALGSAMRALEALTGRPLDVFERVPDVDAAIVLVAAGELGESLVAEVLSLREQGHDVAAVKITAFRPFPGPSLVKATSRAHAISVLETVDEPLAQSNPLTREVKAAFADALTWAPEYPGVGRIPRILSGVVGRAGHELEPHDLEAVVHNMLVDERGKRHFVFGAGEALSPEVPPAHGVNARVASPGAPSSARLSVRGCLREWDAAYLAASLSSAVVSSVLGLRVRASVGALSAREDGSGGGGSAVDLLADRDRPRGRHAPRSVNLIVIEDLRTLREGNPLVRLAEGGLVAFPSTQRSADALWAEVPPYAKALIAARQARVVGWPKSGGPASEDSGRATAWLAAAAFAGVTLARAGFDVPALDGLSIAREVREAVSALLGEAFEGREALAERAAKAAREAFEGLIDVPETTVLRDQEAIRLGRLDPRAAARPG